MEYVLFVITWAINQAISTMVAGISYILPLAYPRWVSEASERSLMSAGTDRIFSPSSHHTCVTVFPILCNVVRQDEPILAT